MLHIFFVSKTIKTLCNEYVPPCETWIGKYAPAARITWESDGRRKFQQIVLEFLTSMLNLDQLMYNSFYISNALKNEVKASSGARGGDKRKRECLSQDR